MPTQTKVSETISKELKEAGFTFCGPTIVYAFMEACGLVNDHLTGCFRWQRMRRARPRHAPRRLMARSSNAPRAWQRMLSGRRLDLLDSSPLDIEIEDIAHGLARVARWNGQTLGAHSFSVAQHCLLVEAIAGHLNPDWIGRLAAGGAAARRARIRHRRHDLALQGGDGRCL